METDLIILDEYCRICHVEPSFLSMLEKSGLIEINTVEGERCLPTSQLDDVERYARMYYDLSINVEGIEAIHHLLGRVELLQEEIKRLKNRLQLYESDRFDEMDEF